MRARFEKEVGEFLAQYNISIESNILFYALLKMLNISIPRYVTSPMYMQFVEYKFDFDDAIQMFAIKSIKDGAYNNISLGWSEDRDLLIDYLQIP